MLDTEVWSIRKMGIKQLENTKTKRKQTEQSFHHFMNLAGTQIDVSICFTEYSQLSSLAAELWTPCCPLLVCNYNITWNKCSLEQSVTHTQRHSGQKTLKKWTLQFPCSLVTTTRNSMKTWNKCSWNRVWLPHNGTLAKNLSKTDAAMSFVNFRMAL